MAQFRVSADIGGTFTDIVVQSSDGGVFIGKVPTTPLDPATGVVNGLRGLVPDLSEVGFFVHGTTVGLNAFLERRGERVLLVTTAGLGDAYTIARGNRHSLYELRYRKPKPLVPRRDVHEVRGRLAWNGNELEALDPGDFDPIIRKVRHEGIRAVAVCFVHAYAHPQHELAAREILARALPEVSISLSHEIAREWREYERASSAVMNAYVAPVVQRYLRTLQDELRGLGMRSKVHVMQSNGGVSTADKARQTPVFTLLSGPVGGTMAGMALAASSGRKNLLCVDMGGTSFDISLVIDGQANTTLETELEGLPLLMSIVDIETIGTGGGSIAWLENDAMRVGPHSAGAVPGPACYGRGGKQPTVTDANLVLGRLGERSLLGGEMTLDRGAAERAIHARATEAGLDPTDFAEGVLAISNAAMADAMRTATISQGVDPREFTLVAFGGAGPMAAAFLAEELDMREVLVPRFPGAFSAWGMLQTDLRHDFTESFFRPVDCTRAGDLEEVLARLEALGRAAILAEGIGAADLSFRRSADMRYLGQEYSINVPLAGSDLTAVSAAFHAAHERRYGHASPGAPIEFVNLRVAAFGALRKFGNPAAEESGKSPVLGERKVVFAGKTHVTPVVSRDLLPPGYSMRGPLVIEETSATTVVPPGWRASLDPLANLVLGRTGS